MPRIFKVFLYFVYLVMAGGLLAAIILNFHHDKASAPAPTTVSRAVVSKANDKSTTTKLATTPTSSRPSAKATNLTNTGPGNVAGLFLVAGLGGAWLKRQKFIREHAG